MAFNLIDENGISLKKALKKEEPKQLSPLDEAISKMLWINGCVAGDRSSMSYQLSEKMYASIEIKAKEIGNEFIASISQSVIRYMKCSDKQAYLLAKFAIENEIKL